MAFFRKYHPIRSHCFITFIIQTFTVYFIIYQTQNPIPCGTVSPSEMAEEEGGAATTKRTTQFE